MNSYDESAKSNKIKDNIKKTLKYWYMYVPINYAYICGIEM